MIQNITETKPLRDSDFDISVLNFCNEIAKIFSNSILPDNFDHKLYDQIKKEKENHLILANDRVKREQYLKYLRFKEITNVEGRAGFAFGPNLLQQKALVTRGKGAKNPFSNRNHRWHPLIAAKSIVQNLSKIEKITTDEEYFVRGRGKKKKKFKSKTLVFHIKQEGQIKKFKSSETFKINGKFVVTPEKWDDIHEEIKLWTNEDWKFAKCLIPATEACEWYNAVESYCILGIIWGVKIYDSNFEILKKQIIDKLKNQNIDSSIKLPTEGFINKLNNTDLFKCQICKKSINEGLGEFRKVERGSTWKPTWVSEKSKEGDDDSLQLLHIKPLIEEEIRHKAENCSWGHRWCNIAMTDHTIEETLEYFNHVVKEHNES